MSATILFSASSSAQAGTVWDGRALDQLIAGADCWRRIAFSLVIWLGGSEVAWPVVANQEILVYHRHSNQCFGSQVFIEVSYGFGGGVGINIALRGRSSASGYEALNNLEQFCRAARTFGKHRVHALNCTV